MSDCKTVEATVKPHKEERNSIADVITPEKTALLCVDVQSGFLSAYTSKALPRIHELVTSDKFAVKIASKFINAPESSFCTLIEWDELSPGSSETELDPVVEKYSDLILTKYTYGNAMKICSILKSHNVDTILIVGVDTDVCVLQNAGQLFDLGFKVYVDLDGCATNGGAAADAAAVKLMERTIGKRQVLPRTESTF